MLALQKKLIQLKTRSFVKRQQKDRITIGYQHAMHIGVIFTIEDEKKHEEVKRFVNILNKEDKKVEVIAFLGKGMQNHEFKFDFFTEKDFTFTGDVNGRQLITFTSKPFDYLINLDLKPNLFIENILARSKAKCRIGHFSGPHANQFFELMISVNGQEPSLHNLYEQIFHYTKSVKNERAI